MPSTRIRRHLDAALLAAAGLLAGCRAVPPAHPADSILDHRALLARQTWWENRDWDWYLREIPFLDSPDSAIDATYYYRWELLTRHLTYGSPATGYTFTEFIDRPFWSGTYGSISCPLGHQMYEARWLRDRRAVEDFARYWFETPGAEPRSYSNWYGDAVWAGYLVTGDSAFLRQMLPHMVAQYEGWTRERWDATHRMFRWDGMHDGMETNINSRQTADSFAGAEGYRPTLNSYLFADARAISRTAALFGDASLARDFAARAAGLKARVQQELWDPKRQFFLHQFAHDEAGGIRAGSRTYETGPFAGNAHGRELIGYVPWQFELPDAGYEAAWRFLMDTTYFMAPFGPTTVERDDPLFFVSKECCVWSGNAWPYATSQTLTAMANLLNDYRQTVVTRADYFRLLETYTLDQRKNGRPYIAEAADPMTGSWAGHDTYYHSEHYFHSGYVDQIITGLAGLRPRADDSLEVNPLIPAAWDWFALDDVAYRGRNVAILWDRSGRHYGRGAGLGVYVNGRRMGHRDDIGRLVAAMGPAPSVAPLDRPVNFAVNNGRGAFPAVTASYSDPSTPPEYLIDGNIWYDRSPPNRWTARGSGRSADTVQLDFGMTRPVERVSLYFLDDGDDIRPPARYTVERWAGGRWDEITSAERAPALPEGRRANTVSFPRIETARLRVVLQHRPGASSGMTELEAWAHAEPPFAEPVTAPPGFPRASASFTAEGSDPARVIDGRVAYTLYSSNRWSARGTPHATDWLAVDFGAPKRVARVDVHFAVDGHALAAPRGFAVEYWSGSAWIPARIRRRLPALPQGSAVNTVWFAPVETPRVRIVVEHARPAATAVTELEIRGDES